MRTIRSALVAGAVISTISMMIPMRSGLAQTLEAALDEQLASDGTANCVVLLGAGAALTGTLEQICGLFGPGGAPPPSTATAGGGTPPSKVPGIVQQRLREAGDEETGEDEVSGASADAVYEYPSGLSVFVAGRFESLDRDVTTFEDGYDSDVRRITAGADYQFSDRFLAGLAFDYYRQKGDFSGGGGFTNNSYGAIAYATIFPTNRVYLQVVGEYAHRKNERTRIASWVEAGLLVTSGVIDGDYRGDEYGVGALLGYELPIGNFTFNPHAGLDWRRTKYASFSETGTQTGGDLIFDVPIQGSTGLELRFDEDKETSLRSRVGLQASVAIPLGFGILVPQAGADWIREFESDQRLFTVSFVEDLNDTTFTFQNRLPERDWFEANVGVVLALNNGLQVYGSYSTFFQHSFFNSDTATVGFRLAF